MKMLRVAIVEDDSNYRSEIKRYINQYALETHCEFDIIEFEDGADIVKDYKPDYDIILFDIELPSQNGIEAAREIRKSDKDVVIVFITNMAQYAIKGYSVDALDFILKPINYYTFKIRFARAIGRVKKTEIKQILINTKHSVKRLNIDEIYYVESQNRFLYYHTEDDVFSARGTMKSIEQELESFHFVRCNHWYLVNLKHVLEINGDNVLVGNNELEISRRNKTSFTRAFTNYIGGNL
ncbi:LytR/AlgR family response regulator transcription factor [Radiobacillus sp. PE A8.2]|uniref:LytR/AlgR family response regulator transcription factor n=1 Tax=Radiobacillus sp. PE A8.2 TaxID=3380349 RepID=UPI0038906ED3